MQGWTKLFEDAGSPLPVAGNQPLLLDDPQAVWRVSANTVEVFAVQLCDGEPAGARMHLCRFEEGQLLFGIPRETIGLVAVGLPGSTVQRIPLSRLEQWAAEQPSAAPLCLLVENWIERLTAGVARSRLPRNLKLIEAGKEVPVEASTGVAPVRAGVWVSSPDGVARFLGKTPVVLETPCPLPQTGWLSVVDRASLAACDTAGVLQQGKLWAGLSCFNHTLLACVAADAEEALAVEARRLRDKVESESGLVRDAIAQLASIAERETAAGKQGGAAQLPLFVACQLVGAQQGISVKCPWGFGEKLVADPVAAIARASGVRTRRVVLAEDWWRQDNGPLLGFSTDGQPLALLPVSSARYEAVDGATLSRTPVTRENHAKLKSQAHVFYRAFPARVLTLADLVRFSLAGTRREWGYVVVLGLVGGLLGLLTPVATGLIFGRFIPGLERNQLGLVALALGVSVLVSTLFEFTQGIAVLRLEVRMDSSVEAGIWDRLLSLPASFFRQFAAGDLADRAMGIGRIRQVLTQAAMSTVLSFIFSLLSFGLLFYYDPGLALWATALFLVIVGVTSLAAWYQLRFERDSHRINGKVVAIVLQLLSGISRLRIAAAENRALAYWARHFSLKTRLSFQAQTVANLLATFTAAVPVVSSLTIFAVVGLAYAEPLPLGTFLAFNAAFVQIISAAVTTSITIGSILEIVPLCERAQPILTATPESYRAQRDPGILTGDIEISHVAFRYDRHGPLVLDDVSLTIRPGEFVALVGPSGAGKSTILRLLLGFETPTSGSVYYNREDLAGLDLQTVRRQMGVVLQSNRLTPGDLFTNITGGSPEYTLDDAWEAARLAGLDAEIRQMPMGMYTVVTEAEGTLSGGQRQRLMIARAIVAKPRILLFDEATSALDNTTQATVTQSLARLKSTRIVIAHRLSTVMGADRIYVLQRGKIVQQGAYAELLQQPGLFADLAQRQLV